METFVILSAFIEIVVFQNRLSHSKVTVTKVNVSNLSAEQTAHWSTQGLVDAKAYL